MFCVNCNDIFSFPCSFLFICVFIQFQRPDTLTEADSSQGSDEETEGDNTPTATPPAQATPGSSQWPGGKGRGNKGKKVKGKKDESGSTPLTTTPVSDSSSETLSMVSY